MRGNSHVRFGAGDEETCPGNGARRFIPTLPGPARSFPSWGALRPPAPLDSPAPRHGIVTARPGRARSPARGAPSCPARVEPGLSLAKRVTGTPFQISKALSVTRANTGKSQSGIKRNQL